MTAALGQSSRLTALASVGWGVNIPENGRTCTVLCWAGLWEGYRGDSPGFPKASLTLWLQLPDPLVLLDLLPCKTSLSVSSMQSTGFSVCAPKSSPVGQPMEGFGQGP